MKEKKCFIIFLSSVIFFLIMTAGINLFLDAYGIFRETYENQVLEPNKNYVKTKHVIDNKEKYNSFLFGSSKVGHIETDFIENTFCYNMCYSEGVPYDWLDTIKSFLENDVHIEMIMLGLDDFSFTIDPSSHQHNLLRIYYSKLNWYTKFKYYIMRNPFDVYNYKTIMNMIEDRPYFLATDDLIRTGIAYGNDEYIEANLASHMNDPKFLNGTDFYQLDRVEETIRDIQDIINLCDEKQIELLIFINPIHEKTYALHSDITERAKEELAKVTGYWDFSGNNSVNTNNYYWYETSHYRHNVGRMIIERIFNVDCGVDIPADFGVYVEQIIDE